MCFIRLQMARIMHRKWHRSGVSFAKGGNNTSSSNDETSNFQSVYDREPHLHQHTRASKINEREKEREKKAKME